LIKIGITGSSGILGTHLIGFLKKNSKYRIHTFKHNVLNIKKINNWIKKNQFQIIIHLAALVPIKKAKQNYKLAKQINFIGTKNLINALKKHQKKKLYIFFSSSSHVYSFNKQKINEKFEKKGISQYGNTKILAENLLLKNKNFFYLCIGRISSLTSEKQSTNFLLKKIVEIGKKNQNFDFGNSNIRRDFIYVEDVAKIIVKIIKKKITGTINISNSETTHLYSLLNYLNKNYGFNIKHFLGKEETLVLSNKLLLQKIGKYKFLKVKEILKKIF